MSRKLIFLSLLLLIQLGLALGLSMNGQRLEAFNATEELLDFNPADSDQLVFKSLDGTDITLQKQADGWTLPDHFGAPADGQKVANLLQKLTDMRRPWPVAEKGATDNRFKVADDNFERMLSFMQGDKPFGVLLIGSSPGYRKVYARISGENTVYAVPFSSYQVSLKPEDWIDSQQLQMDASQISSVELPFGRLTRKGEKLQLDTLGENESTNEQKAGELIRKMANLTILDIVGKPEQPLAQQVELSFSLTLQNGKVRNYRLLKGGEKEELLLQVSDQPYLYKVRPGLKNELLAYTRELLVKTSDPKDLPQTSGIKPPSAE
jgi:hypothetical protein